MARKRTGGWRSPSLLTAARLAAQLRRGLAFLCQLMRHQQRRSHSLPCGHVLGLGVILFSPKSKAAGTAFVVLDRHGQRS